MKNKQFWIIVLLYLLGAFFRLYQLDRTGIYPDEITWMVKGKESIYALAHLNLDYFRHAWWNSTEETYAIGWPQILISGLFHVIFAGTGKFSLHWFSDIVASRLPLALLGPLMAVALYRFSKRYLAMPYALALSIAYTLNPITIALDRWILHDSFLTLFSFLALSSYIAAAQDKRLSYWPGIWLSLSFLTKPHGILPLVGWIIVLLISRQAKTLKLFITNLISFLLITTIIWPQSWLVPIISIPKYFYAQYVLASCGRPIPNYFFIPTYSPHWSYFLFQIFFRTPTIILILAATALLELIYKVVTRRFDKPILVFPVIAYFTIFLLAISAVATKGGIRYALPLIPWIYFSAGFGLKMVHRHLTKPLFLILISLYLFKLVGQLAYHPDYYLFYNSLIGGPKGAQKYDLVGLCFGSKQALEYLDANHIEGLVGIVGCYDTGPYNTARPLTKNWDEADILILESSYAQQYPDRTEVVGLQNRQLIYTVIQHDVVTARVYR